MKPINIFRFAKRVTKQIASTSGAGVPVEVSGIRRTWQGCPAHPEPAESWCRAVQAADALGSGLTLTSCPDPEPASSFL